MAAAAIALSMVLAGAQQFERAQVFGQVMQIRLRFRFGFTDVDARGVPHFQKTLDLQDDQGLTDCRTRHAKFVRQAAFCRDAFADLPALPGQHVTQGVSDGSVFAFAHTSAFSAMSR